MVTVKQVLVKAREIIADEKRWTTQAYARDAHGEMVRASSSDAVCFCAIGAVRRAHFELTANPSPWEGLAFDSTVALDSFSLDGDITKENDICGYEATLAAFDKAIASQP